MEEQKATGGARRAEVGKRVTAPLTQLFPHHHHHQKNKNKNKKHHFLQIHSRETTPEEEDKMDPSAQSVAAAVHFIQRAVQRPVRHRERHGIPHLETWSKPRLHASYRHKTHE